MISQQLLPDGHDARNSAASQLLISLVLAICCCAGCDRESSSATRPSSSASDPGAPTGANSTSNATRATESVAPPIAWIDRTATLGVDFTYRNGQADERFTILESLGGGIAMIDYDRDGWVDLFATGGGRFDNDMAVGHAGELFRNIQGQHMLAVGQQAADGLASDLYTHGAFAADFDADGFDDVLVSGYGGLQLWRNQGDGTFVEVAEAMGLDDRAWSSGCGWADFNNDGLLDLYVAHYVDWSFENHPFCRGRTENERDICPPREFAGLPDSLYLANPEGGFMNATSQWELKPDGKGLGVIITDFDGNGLVDAYVANDTVNNFLYANSGEPPFREIAMLSGVAADKSGVPNGSMGLGVLDFDRNGRPDIWVTNYEREDFALYRNEGPNAFLHVSDIAGLNVLGGLFVGFGTTCGDLDLDGDEDIIVNNGHVILFPVASPRAQLPLVLENRKGRFQRLRYEPSSYLEQPHEGRGLTLCDWDNDGDQDAVFSNVNAPLAILENTSTGGHWMQLELIGRQSNRSAIGAAARIEIGGEVSYRSVVGGGSYMSTSQSRLVWGTGQATKIDRIVVTWPSGATSELTDVAVDQRIQIVEPARD